MKFPRIVIAGEHKQGFVPPSLLLIASMKRSGVPLHIMYCGFNPVDVRLLQSIAEESVTVINLKTCPNPQMVKTLFETSAMQDRLNVIVCDLGVRGTTAMNNTIDTTASDIAAILGCSIILCCYAENEPRPVIKIIGDICDALEAKNPVRIDGAVFINPFDPHSFQLAENNIGINFGWATLGYIPSELEPPLPTIDSLSSVSSYTRGTFSLRAVAGRISQMQGQIDYLALEAIGKYNQFWEPTGGIPRLKKITMPKVAIMDDIALKGEGNNAELLFKAFGCHVLNVTASNMFATDFDMYYFPHGLGFLAMNSFNAANRFTYSLKSAILDKKVILVNGATGLVFGEKYITPDGSEAKGLGVLPVHGSYEKSEPYDASVPVVCSCLTMNGVLLTGDEKINAQMFPDLKFESSSHSMRCNFASNGAPAGNIGHETYNTIIAGICINLWSNTDVIKRLFYIKN